MWIFKEKHFKRRGTSKQKGPDAREHLACWRNSKVDSEARAVGAGRRVIGDGI